ncbi:hypothetical protein FB562_0515 [Homoserinimonas aerilata]|uniref:Uncharacterized protein n=1 Tax=Homoserinimonas aerilata TaxID=1162970 RepID=A0A542YH83_9MICO|nr:hypothetical protein [Homoserinimonas aerilata]TQL47455.1 hypothetical protein FB562_0515 [Homoserinimonas aerilata]
MDFERMLAWGFMGFIALMLVVVIIFAATPRSRMRAVDDFVRKVRLDPGDAKIRAAVERRTSRVSIAAVLGAAVGFGAAVGVLLLVPEWQSSTTVFLVVTPLLLLGLIGGGVVVTLHESLFQQDADASRIARAISPTEADYVDARRRMTPSILLLFAAAATGIAVVLVILGRTDAAALVTAPALPVFVVAVVGWVAARMLSRRVLSRGQPAGGPGELAWDDALRADTLLRLTSAMTMLCWVSLVASLHLMLSVTFSDPDVTWPDTIVNLLFTWGLIIVSLDAQLVGARRHFLLRLWPDTDFETGVVRGASA